VRAHLFLLSVILVFNLKVDRSTYVLRYHHKLNTYGMLMCRASHHPSCASVIQVKFISNIQIKYLRCESAVEQALRPVKVRPVRPERPVRKSIFQSDPKEKGVIIWDDLIPV
jgi:hypothetical protein